MSTGTAKTEVGSYFISNYPPFSAWSADQLDAVHAAMESPPADVPLGLYLHIPFCRKRCKFCYFKVFTDKNSGEVERYLAALSREIELVSKLPVMGGRPFRFVYFGGGTPSFLSSRQLERLVDRLRANVSWECGRGSHVRMRAGHALGSEGPHAARDRRHAAQPGRRAFRRRNPARQRPRPRVAGDLQSLAVDPGGRICEHEHRPDRRHGRRDVGQMARHGPPRDRAGCRTA